MERRNFSTAAATPTAFVAGLFLFIHVAAATSAAGSDRGSCSFRPMNDAGAVRALLAEWNASTPLPPFDDRKWGLGLDRDRIHLTLQFGRGQLDIRWRLDPDCSVASIDVEGSPDYAGPLPDRAALLRLAQRFGAIAQVHRTLPSESDDGAIFAAVFIVAALAVALLLSWRRRRRPRSRWGVAAACVRAAGVLAIVALLPYEPMPPGAPGNRQWVEANLPVVASVLPVTVFVWLWLSGQFGWGSPRRSDWPALLVFLLALGLREGYARHGIQELEIYFYWDSFFHRHSVVHPLLQMFLQPLAADPYRLMMHVNGVLGSFATLPLYLFVRQRTNDVNAALLVALFFAVHPIIVQMAPTDGPYSLLLAAWFSGLALLSADEIGPRQLFGGVVLPPPAAPRALSSSWLPPC